MPTPRLGSAVAFGLFSAVALAPAGASADVQHVVGKGHTIEAIANRYHVPAKVIMEANHLKDAKRLRPGDVLTIPKADAKGTTKGALATDKDKASDGRTGTAGQKAKDEKDSAKGKGKDHSGNFAQKAKTPGIIHIKRIATTEEADLNVKGKVQTATLRSVEKLFRSPGGQSHPIEARLVSLLGVVSNHFGSRKIEVVSGFRPYTPTQYTPHSNHNHGKAVDFRVVGVPNEVVRDFCRTLKNTGCGYYPNSTFVHMDVREASAFWIDYSKPGEPPHYNAPNVDADEGTSDVHGGGSPAANTAPPAPASKDEVPGTGNAPATAEPATIEEKKDE